MQEGSVDEAPAVPGGPPAPLGPPRARRRSAAAPSAGGPSVSTPVDAAPVSTLGRALALLGDSWTLLILQRAFLGVRRYVGWREALGISESVLAGRLRDLVAAGVLTTHPYRDGGGRTRREYRLAESGLELWALLVAIWSWERRHVPRADPLPELVHGGCGERTDVELACGRCGAAVTARDTRTAREPGATFAGIVSPRLHPRRTRGALPADPLSSFPGTVEILGDRWGTCVLGGALLGMRSFTDFQRELQVSPDVLSDRLRRFVAHGILIGGGDGYRLTAKGRATFPMLMVLVAWGDRWLTGDGARSALRIVHRDCGATLDPRLVCVGCGALLERHEVRFAPVSG